MIEWINNNEVIDKFLEDEKYYLDIGNPHFEFVEDYFAYEVTHFAISLKLDR